MRAILVGVYFKKLNNDLEYSLHELKALAEPLNYEVVYSIRQNKDKPDPVTFIGKGKVDELKVLIIDYNADVVIFDDPLSPSQNRNLEELLNTKVIDRSYLILEIFEKRAKTKEAKLEIALAKNKYLLPRLALEQNELSREGGSSGSLSSKGAGETRRELDRRVLEQEIYAFTKELEEIRKRKTNQIERRKKNDVPVVALVGYTNAGKSSTMNSLLSLTERETEKKVYEKDELFATLDTFSRRISHNNLNFILTDTVGFVSKLPTTLIYSFYHTLEEVKEADLILYVVDISSPYAFIEFQITYQVLTQIKANHIPFLLVFTKIDKLKAKSTIPVQILNYIAKFDKNSTIYKEYNCTFINNKKQDGIKNLADAIYKELSKDYIHTYLSIPYTEGKIINLIEEKANIIAKTYLNDYIYYDVIINEKDYSTLAIFEKEEIIT